MDAGGSCMTVGVSSQVMLLFMKEWDKEVGEIKEPDNV